MAKFPMNNKKSNSVVTHLSFTIEIGANPNSLDTLMPSKEFFVKKLLNCVVVDILTVENNNHKWNIILILQ